jgi:ribosomal subunit interface protein
MAERSASVRISGKNLDIGAALRTRALERLESAIGKYYEGGIVGHVTVSKDGTGFRTDSVLHLSSGITLEASGLAHEAYASLDQMAERIEKRLRRYKRRLKDRSGATEARMAAFEAPSYVIAAPDDLVDEADLEPEDAAEGEGHPAIIAESVRSVHSFTVGEAVSELDLTGSPVVVFRNAGNGRINIVYRRRDGNIGWVDPPASSSTSGLNGHATETHPGSGKALPQR